MSYRSVSSMTSSTLNTRTLLTVVVNETVFFFALLTFGDMYACQLNTVILCISSFKSKGPKRRFPPL